MKWFIITLFTLSLSASEKIEVVGKWLAVQTNIQTWAADFRQVRTLKSLTQPLVSTGEVWFAAPQNFRWELGGNPPQTVAIRNQDVMMVLYPRLKRAERYQFNEIRENQWKETLALLQTGFPRSLEEFEEKFVIRSLSKANDIYQLELQPRSAGARKMMPQINIHLAERDFTLAGTELFFADGSSMRNEFYNIQTDLAFSNQFELSVPENFKLVEPMKTR